MEDSTPTKKKKTQRDRVSEANAWVDQVKRDHKASVDEHMALDLQRYSRYNQKRSLNMLLAQIGEPFNTSGGRMHAIYGLATILLILFGSFSITGYAASQLFGDDNNPVPVNLRFE